MDTLSLQPVNTTRIPQIGDKVIITNYDSIPGNEVARLCKLPYCTVSFADCVTVGSDGNYETKYFIDVFETEYCIGFNWKFFD